MKVFLLQDVEKIGMAGEVLKVKDGFAYNYLIPKKLAVEITGANMKMFEKRAKTLDDRKKTIASKTSMLAEKISATKLSLKRKTHDDGKLFGAVKPAEVVELLAAKGISVGANQIEFDKSIKTTGSHEVTIKLSSKLKPKVTLTVVSE